MSSTQGVAGMGEYDWSLVAAHPAAEVAPLGDDLEAKLAASEYPRELIERALAIRTDRGMVGSWLDTGFPPAEQLEHWVRQQEKLLSSTLVTRAATWADDEMLVDLCANSPETVGEWSVTVERGPNPYAQYRLQERANVTVLEDRKIGLGMSVSSVRNSYIESQRTSVHLMSGWRIRDGFRGLGLSRLLQSAAGPGAGWFGLITYWYVRLENSSATWIAGIEADMKDRPDAWSVETDNLTATITVFDPAPDAGSPGGRSPDEPQLDGLVIRPTEPGDLDACQALINRTHAGLDLFRPYSRDYLEERLEDPNWGPKPFFYPPVYGWDEYRVVERNGTIVACGGLWDRGRDIREVWRRDDTTIVRDPTALMDFGYADGEAEAMAELIRSFASTTAELGRSGLLAPLEFVPDLQQATASLASEHETRELHVMPFTSPELRIDLTISKPYTDLAYW